MKITSTSYKLPCVKAISGHEQLRNSANMPVIVTAINMDNGRKNEYVVKLNASERMHVEARLRELLAAFIAMEMELSIVEPTVVDISNSFVTTLLGKPYYAVASKSIGINVGSKYIPHSVILLNEILLTSQQEIAAQNIFSFDLLIQNSDRNFEKPNLLTDGNDLIMLDHELGFGFLFVLSFLRNTEPWKFIDSDLLWIQKHCLFKRLKGKVSELDNFSKKLSNLNSVFWEKAWELVPNEWKNEDMYLDIKKHIDLINENKEEFIVNLKLVLS